MTPDPAQPVLDLPDHVLGLAGSIVVNAGPAVALLFLAAVGVVVLARMLGAMRDG